MTPAARPRASTNAPEFYGFFFADGRPKRTGLALGLWKRIADHPERLALSASPENGRALYALAGRGGTGLTAIHVANPSAEATTLRDVRPDGCPVGGARVGLRHRFLLQRLRRLRPAQPVEAVRRREPDRVHAGAPGAGVEELQADGERVRAGVAALRLPHEGSASAGYVTVSADGAACTPAVATMPWDLFSRAVEALYAAKRGRERVVVLSREEMGPGEAGPAGW